MRLYTFVNRYLSSIQQGIQSAHIVSELSLHPTPVYNEWASKHKTIVVCDGGNHASMLDIGKCFYQHSLYPTATFYEDEESLNGIMTAVGIILPTMLCEGIDLVRKSPFELFEVADLNDHDFELVKMIARKNLAK